MVTSNPYAAIQTSREWPSSSDGITRISYTFSSVEGNGDDFGGTPTGLFSSDQRAYAREAFLTMERVAKVDFIETGATSSGGADVALRQYSYDESTLVGHVSNLPGNGTRVPIDFGMRTGFNAGNDNGGYFATLLHEIGHTLGLGHPHDTSYGTEVLISSLDNESTTVMSYNNYKNSTGAVYYVQTPQLYDIAALQAKYGANTSYNGGNTTYDLASGSYVKYAGTTWDGGGNDTYDARGISSNVTLDLREGVEFISHFNTFGSTSSGPYSNLTYIWNAFGSNIENAYGGAGNDTINGNALGNTLVGFAGNDTLIGFEGNDSLNGHFGNDRLNGHAGNDLVRGGAGNDVVRGGSGDDTLRGDKGDDIVRGDKGNDVVMGDDGNDYVNGHEGADVVRGGAGNDIVRGGSENDLLAGDAGNDTLDGDKGNDTMDGGAGRDILFGSEGADRFSFYNLSDSVSSARDIIGDFTSEDIIDVSRFDFTGVQSGAAAGSVLGYVFSGNNTIVSAAGSQFSFELSGQHVLTNADFDFS